MKKCDKAKNCQWGSYFYPGYCALEEETENCPKLREQMEMFEYYIIHGGKSYE